MAATKTATKKPAPKVTNKDVALNISAPEVTTATYKIVGTAPLVLHKFGQKARQIIRETQEAGSQAKSKKKREPKDFKECFEQAKYVAENGWLGFPAAALRSAMIDACRLVGFKMTHAKLSIFVRADGFDADTATPLVRIDGGEPEAFEAMVRNATGVCDIRVRPMWRKWSAKVVVQYDAGQFSPEDVTNLLLRAGMQVGIGEGRPNSKSSHGQGWGTFEIAEK